MTELGGLDNSTCKRILDLLEPSSLRLAEIVINRIIEIRFGVDDRDGNGGGCFRMNAAKLTNMIIAGSGDR